MLKFHFLLAFSLTVWGCQKNTDTEETDTEQSNSEQGDTEPADNETDPGESSGEDDSDADWEELDEDGSSADDDDPWSEKEEDTGKESGTCGEEVEAGVACTGGWEDTLCTDQYGEMWWCEDGEWTNDKDE